MPQIRYITSRSQMGAPGVYILEQAPASPIRGQRNRVVAFVGQCVKGPAGAQVIDSYQRFLDVYGGRDRNTNGGTIAGHIWKALQGRRWGKLIISRAIASDAVAASFTIETAAGGGGTPVARIDATWKGVSGNDVQWKVSAATNGDANAFNLTAKLYGKVQLFENIKITTGFDNTNQVIGNDIATFIKVTKLADGRPVNNAASTDGADTDGFTKLGQVVAAYTSVAGSDGTIANTDYTAAGGPMDQINSYRGVHACTVVGRSNTTIKAAIATYAAVASQRVWFITTDDETVSYSSAITERATFNSQRMSYWHNWTQNTDSVTLEIFYEESYLYVLSIISQTDPDVHPGDMDNAVYTKSARGIKNELDDPTRDALDAGGVSYMLHDLDQNGNDVIIPGNALTCDFSVNNRDLDGRYMKDFLLDAIGNSMRGDQFKGNTPSNRAARSGAVTSFLDNLARRDRYILRNDKGVPQFSYVNDGTVNDPNDQAAGDQTDKLIAQLIPKNKRILLLAVVGVDATITEQ